MKRLLKHSLFWFLFLPGCVLILLFTVVQIFALGLNEATQDIEHRMFRLERYLRELPPKDKC